ERDPMEAMHGRRFSRTSLYDHEARASAVVRAPAVLCLARILQILDPAQEASDRSRPPTATPEAREKTSARADPAADRRTARRAAQDCKEPGCAGMDAVARRRDHGAFLQQRLALERVGRARCRRCRSLHRIGAGLWER